jgi:hypothetical protein
MNQQRTRADHPDEAQRHVVHSKPSLSGKTSSNKSGRSVSSASGRPGNHSSESSYSSNDGDSGDSGDSAHDINEERNKRQAPEFRMTTNHTKLLILISKYAQCALSAYDQETWIREMPLFVLIYEGILAEKLSFDFAPQSVRISHEGKNKDSEWILL